MFVGLCLLGFLGCLVNKKLPPSQYKLKLKLPQGKNFSLMNSVLLLLSILLLSFPSDASVNGSNGSGRKQWHNKQRVFKLKNDPQPDVTSGSGSQATTEKNVPTSKSLPDLLPKQVTISSSVKSGTLESKSHQLGQTSEIRSSVNGKPFHSIGKFICIQDGESGSLIQVLSTNPNHKVVNGQLFIGDKIVPIKPADAKIIDPSKVTILKRNTEGSATTVADKVPKEKINNSHGNNGVSNQLPLPSAKSSESIVFETIKEESTCYSGRSTRTTNQLPLPSAKSSESIVPKQSQKSQLATPVAAPEPQADQLPLSSVKSSEGIVSKQLHDSQLATPVAAPEPQKNCVISKSETNAKAPIQCEEVGRSRSSPNMGKNVNDLSEKQMTLRIEQLPVCLERKWIQEVITKFEKLKTVSSPSNEVFNYPIVVQFTLHQFLDETKMKIVENIFVLYTEVSKVLNTNASRMSLEQLASSIRFFTDLFRECLKCWLDKNYRFSNKHPLIAPRISQFMAAYTKLLLTYTHFSSKIPDIASLEFSQLPELDATIEKSMRDVLVNSFTYLQKNLVEIIEYDDPKYYEYLSTQSGNIRNLAMNISYICVLLEEADLSTKFSLLASLDSFDSLVALTPYENREEHVYQRPTSKVDYRRAPVHHTTTDRIIYPEVLANQNLHRMPHHHYQNNPYGCYAKDLPVMTLPPNTRNRDLARHYLQ